MVDINKCELANLIKSFLDGSCGEWDWDDFTSVKQSNPDIEKIRQRLVNIRDEYPPVKPTEYCNEVGMQEMLAIANQLKSTPPD
jgi:hypothetical protein